MNNFILWSRKDLFALLSLALPERTALLAPVGGSRQVLGTAPSDLMLFLSLSSLFGIFLNCFTSETSSSSGDSRACSLLRGRAQLSPFQVQSCMLSKSTHQLVPGASQTISKVLVTWTLHTEPQERVPMSNLGAQDFWFPELCEHSRADPLTATECPCS